jgi:uncharacterized membrane protein YgdD (TMEM256/DUF423 family)
MKKNNIIVFASLTMAVGVGFGAIGAHALKDLLNDAQLDLWNKGVFYQLVHGLGLLIVAVLRKTNNEFNHKLPTLFFKLGIVLFSGSLYLIAINKGFFGEIALLKYCLIPVTPLGGISLIMGWIFLAKNTKIIKIP